MGIDSTKFHTVVSEVSFLVGKPVVKEVISAFLSVCITINHKPIH